MWDPENYICFTHNTLQSVICIHPIVGRSGLPVEAYTLPAKTHSESPRANTSMPQSVD